MSLDWAFEQEERERDGKWFQLPPKIGGEFFGVWAGSVGDKQWRRLEKFEKEKRQELGLMAKDEKKVWVEPLPQEVFEECMARAMAGCTVRKIRGVKLAGKELKSTPDNVRLVLSSNIVRNHINTILRDRYAFDLDHEPDYGADDIEEAAGNSGGGSASTESGTASPVSTVSFSNTSTG